jgi:hypothetical protein
LSSGINPLSIQEKSVFVRNIAELSHENVC